MATGSVSSLGIGAGIDSASIVSQLMSVERQPLVNLQTQATGITSQISTFGQLQSLTSAMRDKASALTSLTLWGRTTASSSAPAVVGATTSSGSVAGNYSVLVSHLATSQSLTSRPYGASTDLVGAGSLTIELGSWTGGDPPTAFSATSGKTPLSITTDSDDTLGDVRDKINASGGDVIATIITDASGQRLSIRSKTTGAENAFRITASETADDGVASTGLSALAYDPPAGIASLTRNETATNAEAQINGIPIVSASNTLTNVSDGLTLTLSAQSDTAVQVNVTADSASVKSAITDFVTAFNALASFLHTQTAYNADSKTAGALQGDSTATGFQSQLRDVINQQSTASSVFSSLSDIGISMNEDGTLTTDSTKLDAALTNLPELRKVLATDGPDTASSGFMDRFSDLGDAVLGFDGSFQTRTDSLHTRLDDNADQQADMQRRLDAEQARLEAQYQALDASMAKLSQLSSYVSQQLSVLSAVA